MPKRVLAIVAVAVVAAGVALFFLRPERGAPEGAPRMDEMARAVGTDVMTHLHRGHVAGRSGEIMLVPKPHHFLVTSWDPATYGTDRPSTVTSHPNPWDYLARVPIALYGPGYFDAGVRSNEPVDISQLAGTFADLTGFDEFRELQGGESRFIPGSLPSVSARGRGASRDAPKVIFTVVIDGGGWNALQQHPTSWPAMRRLMDEGVLFSNATIGSAPSITGALHATFGTGRYPADHGLPGNQMRAPDGSNVDTWLENADPRYLELPTLSELWDEANGNEPIVASVSYEGWHLGMIGHGAQREGGDRDIGVLWEAESSEWWINEDYYTLPSYLQETDLARLESYERALDARDGLVDEAWFGKTLEEVQEDLMRPATPAFVRFTGDAVVDVLRNEDFGKDDLTDYYWVEMKMPDFTGHAFNMLGPEEADVLLETDRQIARFVEELDKKVGRGNYVFALSADHGQQPLPDTFGGWRINNRELQKDIEDRFGNVVEKVTPVDIYLDADAIEEQDVDPAEIASYMGAYTIEENLPGDSGEFDSIPDAKLDDTLFAGAFTTDFFRSLDPEALDGFGPGDYPEGDLYNRRTEEGER